MPKTLGQIHTTNHPVTFLGALEGSTPFVASNIDVSGELTSQLQRMVRAGNFFKTVGIDITIGLNHDQDQAMSVSGELRYYAPTMGRCEAFRSAFKAMADQMTIQGISMRDNPLYDFRAPLNPSPPADLVSFQNQATLDGTNGLSLNDPNNSGQGIFNVHNDGVRPVYQGSDVFSQGFKTLLDPAGGTDFVLNDVAPYTGNANIASLDYETIPFQLSFSTTTDEQSTATFQFRPDPALYVAVMCGQFQVVVNDMEVKAIIALEEVTLNIAVMTSGWKSIMGNPDKKKRSRTKTKTKSSSKKKA